MAASTITVTFAEAFQSIARSREPDFVVGDPANPYLKRWHVRPRNEVENVYLHQFLHSDEDRALHDHPYDNGSIILQGCYLEHTPEGAFFRHQGDTIMRRADQLHRIELINGNFTGEPLPVWSLFMSGPRIREWGFQCPGGWIPWHKFVDPQNPGMPGPGCGA